MRRARPLLDEQSPPCPRCKGTRQRYSFHIVQQQRRAQRVCLVDGCTWGIGVDCAWETPLILTTVEQVRDWWAGEGAALVQAERDQVRPSHDLKPGELVHLTGNFIKATGQVLGGEGPKEFRVQAVDGDYVVTDEALSDLSYWTPEELEAEPLLRFRRIHAGNLCRVGEVTLRNPT